MKTSRGRSSIETFATFELPVKMKESRRQKKVASLIHEALSQPLAEAVQVVSSSLVTITRVEITADLRAARVYLSVFDTDKSGQILDTLNKRKGFLRKSVASKTKLKYNPTLFFSMDLSSADEANIDRILQRIKNEGRTDRDNRR